MLQGGFWKIVCSCWKGDISHNTQQVGCNEHYKRSFRGWGWTGKWRKRWWASWELGIMAHLEIQYFETETFISATSFPSLSLQLQLSKCVNLKHRKGIKTHFLCLTWRWRQTREKLLVLNGDFCHFSSKSETTTTKTNCFWNQGAQNCSAPSPVHLHMSCWTISCSIVPEGLQILTCAWQGNLKEVYVHIHLLQKLFSITTEKKSRLHGMCVGTHEGGKDTYMLC